MTYRGHTAAITSVTASPELKQVFSASLDSTIRIWKLLPHDHDPYSSYDPSLSIQKLVGHTEAIWDLCLLPNLSPGPSTHRLVSASADGTVKIWTSEGGRPWSLTTSVGDFVGVPTCLGIYQSDYNKVLIGTSGGEVHLYNVEKQVKEVVFGTSSACYEERADAQRPLNRESTLSYPTQPCQSW
jgi:striatin 1/3/4